MEKETLTVKVRDSDRLQHFVMPPSDVVVSWWGITDGTFHVVESFAPTRRVRYFPLISIEWWEQAYVA